MTYKFYSSQTDDGHSIEISLSENTVAITSISPSPMDDRQEDYISIYLDSSDVSSMIEVLQKLLPKITG